MSDEPLEYMLSDLPRIGAAIAAVLQPGDVIGLSGDLGAGKTALARAILAALGLAGEAPSPSFAIVQPYDAPPLRLPLWHVDLYRLDDPDETVELGLDEARSDAALLVEWPERGGRHAPRDMVRLYIAGAGERRRLTVELPPAWEPRWPHL